MDGLTRTGTAAVTPTSQDAVRFLERAGRRYAAGIRIVTLTPTVVIALAAADGPRMRLVAGCVLGALAVWSGLVFIPRTLRGPSPWVTVVDGALLALLAVSTPWVVPAAWLAASRSWLVPFANFACVAYQYYAAPALGAVAAATVAVAAGVVTNAAGPQGPTADGIITGCWSFVAAMLARLLWTLVHRAGSTADEAMRDAESARRRQRVAAEIRADERAVSKALHDTAATTLLMVGTGQAGHLGPLLATRAARDLQVLRNLRAGTPPAPMALCRLLQQATSVVPLTVTISCPAELELPAVVSRAMAAATTEALTNAARHGRVDAAAVRVEGDRHHLEVEIRDEGVGFDPTTVPTTRHGVRDSIVARMRDIGGDAVIESGTGRGTTIRLEWEDPDGRP